MTRVRVIRDRRGLTLVEVLVALAVLAVASAVLATSQAFHARLLGQLAGDADAVAVLRSEIDALRVESRISGCYPRPPGAPTAVACTIEPVACPLPAPDCELVAAVGAPFVELAARAPSGGAARVRVASPAPLLPYVVEGR